MPNYCENTLTIQSNCLKGKSQLKVFKATAKKPVEKTKSVISFENLLPTPKELNDNPSPPPKNKINKFIRLYGAKDWYDWRIKNWGTKWDACEPSMAKRVSDTELIYFFDTAWSPPLELFKEISKQYPDLTFRIEYEERSMWFAGDFKVKNGEVLYNREFEPERDLDEEGLDND